MNDALSLAQQLRTEAQAVRAALVESQRRLRAEYEASTRPGGARAFLAGRARAVDDSLKRLWRLLPIGREAALIAVGGYGRRMLYPYSDVDLLVLVPDGLAALDSAQIEEFVGVVWDIGIEPGHAVRTIAQCLDEAARDICVQTTLLETRLIAGRRSLYAEFERAVRAMLDPQAFFKGKRLEQSARHTRFQETPYSLEPNCKEAPGGLRDLQLIRWVAKAAGLSVHWPALGQSLQLLDAECRQLARVERFLEHVRIRLHCLAGRKEDRLVFEHQEALARAFGVAPKGARRASEVFMQIYYRNAKQVEQLNTTLLQAIGAHIFPKRVDAPVALDEHFQMQGELLDVRSEDVFEREPVAILESFLHMQRHSELKGMTARTLRALWRARRRIDPAFRHHPVYRAQFLELLKSPRGIVHEFRRMNRYGILGRYLPAFGRIVGQMQYDLFHVYTVDQHILQVLRNLRRFTMPEHAHEYPFCSRLMSEFDRHWLIYVAALFHDIAKGRGGDHSKLGMRDARAFCRAHGIDREDSDLVVFLVEHHLSMSQVAQKQDISDPQVVAAFAKHVKSERRLTALYLLTVADIRGTSPKVWNNWKAKLLEDLYRMTRGLLTGAPTPVLHGVNERQEEARSLLRRFGLREGVEAAFWAELDTVYFLRHGADDIAWHSRILYGRVAPDEPIVRARMSDICDGIEVMVYLHDRPRLFLQLCGFFGRMGYNIVDVKVHTTRHGYALDSFVLMNGNSWLGSRSALTLIEHDLTETLRANGPPMRPAEGRSSRQVRHFPITPEISLIPDERGAHHLLSITASDRPGLLYRIAETLADNRVNLHTAKVTTLGERAEDVFLVSGDSLTHTQTLLRIEQSLLEALQA
ncbi:MAG: bifunctional uridylyltransferase/uridylyl-removing enzyme [Betaproteobacteria bacterium]